MKCHYFLKLLNRYVDGVLVDKEREEIELHLNHCPNCYKEYKQIVFLREILASKDKISVSEDFFKKVMSKISSAQTEVTYRWKQLDSLARKLIPVPVMIALALTFFIFRGYSPQITLDDYYLSMFSEEEVSILEGAFSAEELLGIKGGV